VRRFIEKIYFAVPARPDCQHNNGAYPGHPDQPFKPITSRNLFIPGKKDRFLTTSTRAAPTAIASAQEKCAKKHKGKKNKTTVDNAF
jgi:hypothetical protein